MKAIKTSVLFLIIASAVYALPPYEDYGDAPSSYGLACRKVYNPSTPIARMGDYCDREHSYDLDLTRNDALGDDVDQGYWANGTAPADKDDEDGVLFPTDKLVRGKSSTIKVTTFVEGVGAYLNGWIDFNANYDFLDSGEHVIGAGTNDEKHIEAAGQSKTTTYTVSIPASAPLGRTFSRFIFEVEDNNNPVGEFTTIRGEVEDYVCWIADEDYGDAPISGGFNYGQAGHYITNDPIVYMGSLVDDDDNYSGDINADNDDVNDGSDDEDGVTFYKQEADNSWAEISGDQFYKNTNYKVVVDVMLSANQSAKLAAWFDYFVDGEFGNEPEETLIDNVTVTNSSGATASVPYEQMFTIPNAATEDVTYIRFRVDAQTSNLTPTGIGDVAGEVEDYVTTLGGQPPISVTLTSFVAGACNDGVKIEWNAATEINHAGYNLYRSDGKNGTYDKINDVLIAVPKNSSSTVGGHYEFIDADGGESAWYKLESISLDGSSDFFGPVQAATTSGVEEQQSPADFALAQNYPNPFNPSTTIEYAVPNAADVSLVVYDVQGKIVKTLVKGLQSAGRHAVVWDATNQAGERVSSGLYFFRMKADHFTKLRRMTLLR